MLINTGYVSPVKYQQQTAFEAAEIFTKSEGIIPAPESSHAIAAVIDIAREHKEEEQTIIFNLSGHGLLDLLGYQRYLANELE